MRKILLAAAVFSGFTSAATANDFGPMMRAYFDSSVIGWTADPVLVSAIKAQNSKTGALSQGDIDALDLTWRAQVGQPSTPIIDPILNSPAAEFLRQQVAASGGAISEVFAMDARGLNVAASTPTSDYWQGDEAKFTDTYSQGPGAIHVGDVEFDESSQSYQGQVSIVVVDPDTGNPIGAITVGLNAEALM
jgi:hypothetical protein